MADEPILEKKFNEGIDIDKRLKEGAILSRLFIEVQGNDKDAAKKALETTVFNKMAGERPVTMLSAKLYDIQPDREGKTFSGVVEIKALFRDFRWFVSVVMRYGPSAIEIIEPERYTLKLDEMQSLIADVSEFSQTFSSQIISLLKDGERKALYKKVLSGGKGEQ